MKRLLLRAVALVGVTCFAPSLAVPAQAAIIYDNGGSSGGGFEATQWVEASDFALAVDAILTGIHFLTIEIDGTPGYQGSVYYLIYGNDPVTNTPDATNVWQEGLVSPARFFFVPTLTPGQNQFSYHVDVSPLALVAGTYWLALHNGPLSTTFRAEWYWAAADDKPTTFHALKDVAPFDGVWESASRKEHAFYLTGPDAIPEPHGLSLFLASLTAIAGRRLRRRRPASAHFCEIADSQYKDLRDQNLAQG